MAWSPSNVFWNVGLSLSNSAAWLVKIVSPPLGGVFTIRSSVYEGGLSSYEWSEWNSLPKCLCARIFLRLIRDDLFKEGNKKSPSTANNRDMFGVLLIWVSVLLGYKSACMIL